VSTLMKRQLVPRRPCASSSNSSGSAISWTAMTLDSVRTISVNASWIWVRLFGKSSMLNVANRSRGGACVVHVQRRPSTAVAAHAMTAPSARRESSYANSLRMFAITSA
jgi:hypothetical protein